MFDYMKSNPLESSIGLGAGGAALGSMFGDYQNPADAASPFLDRASRELPQYYKPYMQAGQQALPQLQGAYSSMMDPNALISKIGSGYQKSPGYDWMLNQGNQATQNAAAAGGMLGSPQHQQQAATMNQGLANQDYYNYLSKALGLYGQGAQGQQHLFDTGAGASMNLGDNLSSLLGSQAQLAYQGQNAQNQHEGGQMGGLFGGVASMLPFLLG